MIFGAAMNVVLNPILIFGLLGLPAMGVRGSALATVISQFISTMWLLHLLSNRHHLLSFRHFPLREYLESYRRIIGFAVPCVLGMILMPISATVITQIVSRFGHEAVAGGWRGRAAGVVRLHHPDGAGDVAHPFYQSELRGGPASTGSGRRGRFRPALR